jgi:hypothetical protein
MLEIICLQLSDGGLAALVLEERGIEQVHGKLAGLALEGRFTEQAISEGLINSKGCYTLSFLRVGFLVNLKSSLCSSSNKSLEPSTCSFTKACGL